MTRTVPVLLVVLALAATLPAAAQPADRRVGAAGDPVGAAIAHSQAAFSDGEAGRVLLGRADDFADNLAGAPLTGPVGGGGGPLLLTAGGPAAALSAGVADEGRRVLGGADGCAQQGDAATADVLVLGGPQAVADEAVGALAEEGFCVARLAGATRVETAVAVAERVVALGGDTGRVFVARSDDWPDAATGGAAAARGGHPVLVTPSDALHPAAAAFLDAHDPGQIVLLGGAAALSDAVAAAAGAHGPVLRVAGAARDATAAAIARQVFPEPQGGVVLANGYVPDGWVHALAVAALSAQEGAPVLYAQPTTLPPGTAAYLDERPSAYRVLAGPEQLLVDALFTAGVGDGDLGSVTIDLLQVAELDSPLGMVVRPDTGELYLAEQTGRVRVLNRAEATRRGAEGPAGGQAAPDAGGRGLGEDPPTVLDLSDDIVCCGEQGLLGIAFSPDSRFFYASYSNSDGDGQLDEYDVDGEIVVASRRTLMVIPDDFSNHNGGHILFGPDGYLWFALGDGGGGGDPLDEGQDPFGLLGSILRIDPLSAEPYAIPPGNPFADGTAGAPEVYQYGLRNPWRFSFDSDNADLWIGDVGQGQYEEVDWFAAGTGAGANLGWNCFEGFHPFSDCGSPPPATVLPIHEYDHGDGSCSITGGFVYRGAAIPALRGAYVYGDFCRGHLLGLTQESGRVTATRDLGEEVNLLASFGEDAAGELYVLSLSGPVYKIVPG